MIRTPRHYLSVFRRRGGFGLRRRGMGIGGSKTSQVGSSSHQVPASTKRPSGGVLSGGGFGFFRAMVLILQSYQKLLPIDFLVICKHQQIIASRMRDNKGGTEIIRWSFASRS